MSGPNYRILKAGDRIRVAANKSIYTDGGGSRIKYQLADTSGIATGGIQTIPESNELQFLSTMDIEVISGNILLIESTATDLPRTVDLTTLKGFPVLLGTKIEIVRKGARLDLAYYNGAELQMNGPVTYQTYALGSKSKDYSVSLRQENAWYYAKLGLITPQNHTSALVTLFSPQIQADKEPPLFNLSQSLRAPIYQDYRFDLGDLVTDNSGVRDLFIDTDLTTDSDGDGRKDNDRDTESPTGLIRKGNSPSEIFVRSQNSLFTRAIKIWATDEVGNTASKETKLVMFAPIPNISNQSGTLITG